MDALNHISRLAQVSLLLRLRLLLLLLLLLQSSRINLLTPLKHELLRMVVLLYMIEQLLKLDIPSQR